MRPARKGPENLTSPEGEPTLVEAASMRPARKGPENQPSSFRFASTRFRFNEAGPQGAGKPRVNSTPLRGFISSFNEAGPQGAGKPE